MLYGKKKEYRNGCSIRQNVIIINEKLHKIFKVKINFHVLKRLIT